MKGRILRRNKVRVEDQSKERGVQVVVESSMVGRVSVKRAVVGRLK